jgi:tripartite-type tricarboxylate transporter receptor subunit TctC
MERKGRRMGKMIFLFGFFLLLIPTLSFAQEYPTKPINLLVNRAPGGTADTCLRGLVRGTERFLGQPFIVHNNGGGGGSVALGIIAKEKPDGYHLIGHSSTALAEIPQLRGTSAYKFEDFVPICRYGVPHNAIAVRSDSPWTTLKEFVEYTKKNPGKVTFGTGGVGLSYHLAVEYVAIQDGLQLTHVPFPGSILALTALLGGHVNAFSGGTEFVPYVQAGTLRLLAIEEEERMKMFPNVPTLKELGYDYVTDNVFMVTARNGTPPSTVKKLEEAFRKAMDDPQFIQVMNKTYTDISYEGSAESKKYLEVAYPRYGKRIEMFKSRKIIK